MDMVKLAQLMLLCPNLKKLWAERCTIVPANSIFSSPITSTFNAVRFNENPFTCQCEKEDRNSEGFQILHFIGHFEIIWQ